MKPWEIIRNTKLYTARIRPVPAEQLTAERIAELSGAAPEYAYLVKFAQPGDYLVQYGYGYPEHRSKGTFESECEEVPPRSVEERLEALEREVKMLRERGWDANGAPV